MDVPHPTLSARLPAVVFSALLCATSLAVHAQDVSAQQEQVKNIKAPEASLKAGSDLFGDSANLYTGGLGFTQTDVTLPGNNTLPVAIGRRLNPGSVAPGGRPFGRWDLDIPHIHTTVSTTDGWVTKSGDTKRCSNFSAPKTVSEATVSYWEAKEFWPGTFIYVPGAGDQRMLLRATGNTRAPASSPAAYPVVTSDRWALSCLTSLASDTSAAKTDGEGFLAVSPDGTRYTFDWMVSYDATALTKGQRAPMSVEPVPDGQSDNEASTNQLISLNQFRLPRKEVWLLPTLLTDRFGNTVKYSYDPALPRNLIEIASSDGRVLKFTYGSGPEAHLIKTVSDGTRTWQYSHYQSEGLADLDRVTLPDGSSWQLAGMSGMFVEVQITESTECGVPMDAVMNVLNGTMVHPSGASASFTLAPTLHGRSDVPKPRCGKEILVTQTADRFFTNSLTSKTISGPGLQEMTWQYDYGPANAGWAPCDNCTALKVVSVTDPEGRVTRHIFGNRFGVNEGKLQQVDYGWDGISALRTVATRYRAAGAGPYLPEEGTTDRYMGDAGTNIRTMPVDRRVTTQQGVTFTWEAASFDVWARALQVTRSSSLGMSRTETTAYENNVSRWVLGQVREVKENSTGKVAVLNGYNATTAKLETVTRFGRLDLTMKYHPDGTLKTRSDGKTRTDGKEQSTGFWNYKRGIAQEISYPDGTGESAVVNNIGTIDSKADAGGFATGYEYDAMGRLAKVTPSADDSVAWNSTKTIFEQVWTDEYDLAPGHWRQTATTGTARTITYYDALWRPVYTQTEDLADSQKTSRIIKRSYDAAGRTTFQSYPQRTYAAIAGGTNQQYDALGRKTVTGTNSELGMIWSGYVYGSNFTTTFTTGRGIDTTSSYQVFDEPSENAIASISAPEGVSVNIVRDVFGKPSAITRSGLGKSAKRSYVYDANQRLCKTIEPETGATVQNYDGANNVWWRASGLSLPSTSSCDTTSVSEAKKTVYGYDSLNRLLSTSYGDGSPGIWRMYTMTGSPWTVNSGGMKWTYGYNRRGLLETESLVYNAREYLLLRYYDANASVKELIYPDGISVTYDPNALGEPTHVGGYAKNVTYHPNGAIAGFRYGNEIWHTLDQNQRGLPERSIDTGILNDLYAYDQNSNVTSILDWHEGVSNRAMEYDQLDRLKRTFAPAVWGDARYDYDALDNLTGAMIERGAKARKTVHTFDPSTNRLKGITGPAGYNFAYDYDDQGNVKQRGAQRYVFDQGNRMKEATGKATYVYDGWGRRSSVVGSDGLNRMYVYTQDGKLMYSGPTSGAKRKYIYLGNHMIAEDGVAGLEYIHTDALGSPVARTSGSAALISRTRYEPYGLTAMGAEPIIGFTGHVNDFATGLVYMQQRYYDPIAGRMLSIDPVTTDANTGRSFNRYSYAANHPYKYIDPDGRELIVTNLPGLGRAYLDDAFAPKVTKFIENAKAGGVVLKFTSAYRSVEKQAELKKDPKAITPADTSLHSAGFAVDVAFSSLKDIEGGLTGDEQRKVIKSAAKDSDLSWGGNFKKTDPPHFYSDPGDRAEKIEDATEKYEELKVNEK